ncbi:hypothetical protein NMY22_g1887 [Coprinellus aureogranulatus]|nr:hypothetical protein NMY22_g1887 [Coprinellus aureogranulatus]
MSAHPEQTGGTSMEWRSNEPAKRQRGNRRSSGGPSTEDHRAEETPGDPRTGTTDAVASSLSYGSAWSAFDLYRNGLTSEAASRRPSSTVVGEPVISPISSVSCKSPQRSHYPSFVNGRGVASDRRTGRSTNRGVSNFGQESRVGKPSFRPVSRCLFPQFLLLSHDRLFVSLHFPSLHRASPFWFSAFKFASRVPPLPVPSSIPFDPWSSSYFYDVAFRFPSALCVRIALSPIDTLIPRNADLHQYYRHLRVGASVGVGLIEMSRIMRVAEAALTSSRTAANSIYSPPILQAHRDLNSVVLHTEDSDYTAAYSYFFDAFANFGAHADDAAALDALNCVLFCQQVPTYYERAPLHPLVGLVHGSILLRPDDVNSHLTIKLVTKLRGKIGALGKSYGVSLKYGPPSTTTQVGALDGLMGATKTEDWARLTPSLQRTSAGDLSVSLMRSIETFGAALEAMQGHPAPSRDISLPNPLSFHFAGTCSYNFPATGIIDVLGGFEAKFISADYLAKLTLGR